MGLKVAVIGAGSTYTPELIDGLAARRDRLPIDELVLEDVDDGRRELLAGVAGRMLRRIGWEGRLSATDDPAAAVEGADFVLIQLRIGGQAARLVDETLPLEFGTIGQETTGAGGFAKALRTIPVVLQLAELTARHAAPGAWIIDFTNPVGIVSQALLDRGYRAIGLCNVAIGFQRRFAARFGVEPERVELDHVGLNHLSWIRAVRVDGVDRLPELLEEDGPVLARELRIGLDELHRLRAIPSYYLRYYSAFDEVLAEQRHGHQRAAEVIDIEAQLLELYRDPTLDTKPALLEHRGGAFYSEAAAQLLASLHDDRGDVQVLDVRNGGALPGLAEDDVVEVPSVVDRHGAHPQPVAPLPPELLSLVQRVKAYERLTIQAATSGDRRVAATALESNPLVNGRAPVDALLAALLERNRRYLPQFFPT
jgi:6-phospho-beta-glucosidase